MTKTQIDGLSADHWALPPELLFSDVELRVLGDYAQSRRRPRPTSLEEAVGGVAVLGDYISRN